MRIPMNLRYLAIAPALVLVVVACGGSGSASPSVAGTNAGQIAVKLTDDLRMDPAQISVKAGQPVTFVVTNAGATQHEFYLGDSTAQDAHEQEMRAGGMAMDETDGIVLKAGETKTLTHTFPTAGASLAGCHEAGHYGGGMKATITVAG
jgi:uncharacterized cupredoxin-like copper-binding protein